MRENPAQAPVVLKGRQRGKDRGFFPVARGEGWEAQTTPWSGKIAVLVTSLEEQAWLAWMMPKQYRDRADAEHSFDELKNQWGCEGFTSRQLGPSRMMANLVALFYKRWNLYVRFFDEGHHREAIRSRPLLMQGVGRQTCSAGQRTVKVSLVHEGADLIAATVTLVSKELQQIAAITERWTTAQRWSRILTRILRRWLGGKWLPGLPP